MRSIFKTNRGRLGLALLSGLFFCNPSVNSFFLRKSTTQKEVSVPTKTFIWGNGRYQARPDAQMGFSNFEPKLIKNFVGSQGGINLREIAFGDYHEAGIDNLGHLYAWKKQGVEANFANPETDNSREQIVCIDSKSEYTQISFTNGFLWGLTLSATVQSDSRRQIKTLPGQIIEIACGHDHLLALTKMGEVYSMGDDMYGQCGLGQMNRSTAPPFYERRVKNPRLVEGLGKKVKKIACGANHSLAITEDGRLYGWGSNSSMQLSQEEEFSRADEPIINLYSPVQITKGIENNTVIDVAGGEQHTVIVTENMHSQETEVYACGHNNKGELGAGFVKHLSDTVKIESLSNFQVKDENGKTENVRVTKVKCGNTHCVALLNLGVIALWGENEYGQIGNKKRAFSEHPILISTFKKEKVLNVSAGYTSTAVICVDQQKSKLLQQSQEIK